MATQRQNECARSELEKNLSVQRNGNDNISNVILSTQSGGIFKIPTARFRFEGISPNQNR